MYYYRELVSGFAQDPLSGSYPHQNNKETRKIKWELGVDGGGRDDFYSASYPLNPDP